MANLKIMQAYADKCADKLGIDTKPALRWQTPDCKLGRFTNAHCHKIDGKYPRGTICLHRQRIPAKTIREWHHIIAHEVCHLAVKSSHSTATFARRMVALGVANNRDKGNIQREKSIRKHNRR